MLIQPILNRGYKLFGEFIFSDHIDLFLTIPKKIAASVKWGFGFSFGGEKAINQSFESFQKFFIFLA